jgi:hypothetical protein
MITNFMNSLNVETNLPISLLGSSLLARANEGRMLHAFGHAIVVLLDGKQTPAGSSPPFSISLRRATGRGRITTNAKTNGSTLLKAGLVF